MAEGDIRINFRSEGAGKVQSDLEAVGAATREAEQEAKLLRERLERFQSLRVRGLLGYDEFRGLSSDAKRLSAQRVGISGTSHVVSKEAQMLAAAGGKFSAGMSAGAASLNYAARIMGDSSGAMAKVAANLSSLGAIGAGSMSVAQTGGVVGMLGRAGLAVGVGMAAYDVGGAIGDWLVGVLDETQSEEYKERARRARERFLGEQQVKFDAVAFDRTLAGLNTAADAEAALKTAKDALWERTTKMTLGLDGSRENEQAIERLEKEVVALRKKQVALLAEENRRAEDKRWGERGAALDDVFAEAERAKAEAEWTRTYDAASAVEKASMARAAQEKSEADIVRLSTWLMNNQGSQYISDEEWNAQLAALTEAQSALARFADLVESATDAVRSEAEERARQEAEDAERAAEADAERREAVFAGGYQSGGNSLARVGLMASSPVVRSIEITARNTAEIAAVAEEISRKLDLSRPAVAG